jgi:S-adenosylmethionine hydrolase
MHRMHKTHRQQHQLRVELEFAAGYRLELVVDLDSMQFCHLAVDAGEFLRQYRVFALGAFSLA